MKNTVIKKILVNTGYVFTGLIVLASIGLFVIVFFKPHLLNQIIAWLLQAIEYLGWRNYVFTFLITLIESIPFVNMAIPGQTFVLIISGFVAQSHFWEILLVVIVGGVVGDMLAYFLGRYKGKSILRLYGSAFGFTPSRVESVIDMLKNRSHWAIFASKWNAYTRGILPFIAGSARVNFREFMVYNILGSIIYSCVLVFLAKLFVGHYQIALPYIRWIGAGIIVIVGIWYFVTHKNASKTG